MEAKDTNEMESRILEAAKRVFVHKGYEAATMSDVAAAGRPYIIIIGRKRFCSTLFSGNCFLHCCRTSIGFWMRRVRCWRKCR
jgi:hypothetical protein